MSGFRHEALFYAGDDEFVAATAPIVEEAVAARRPAMVAVPRRRLDRLRARLGAAGAGVRFVDMESIGANPACIIPAWRDFAEEHADAPALFGIGEPIWAGRSETEMSECHLHEALLNIAFADAPDFRLVCPYDTVALPADDIECAHRHHPLIADRACVHESDGYDGVAAALARLAEPLPEPPATAEELRFDGGSLAAVRRFAVRQAAEAGLDPARRDDLVLALTEAATNSVRHAAGHGTALAWREGDALVLEVRDDGRLSDPLAGRARPALDRPGGGWGLWLVNQLTDLAQLRTSPAGTAVRMHIRAAAPVPAPV